MLRATAAALLVAGGLIAAVPAAPPAGAAAPSVLMVGDSTMRGMSASAQAVIRTGYDLTFDSGSCRRLIVASCKPIPNALSVIRSNPGRDALVIMTGYNDWTIGAAVDAIMAEAGAQGTQTVIWLTYRTDIVEGAQKPIAISQIFREHNQELAVKAQQHPDLLVLDWDGYSAGHDDWFAWDGFHLANPGGFALANLLKNTLDGLGLARCQPEGATGTPVAGPADLAPTTAPAASLATSAARRILDTRAGQPLGAGRSTTIPVVSAGFAPAGSTSVVINLAAVDPCRAGFLTAYPCGAVPLASNVNFGHRRNAANLAAVRLDGNGALCVYSSAQTDLVLDVLGAFGPGGTLRFNAVAPQRIIDTRAATGAVLPRVGALPAGTPVAIKVAGTGPIPDTAKAVALNLTIVGPTGPGFLTAFPCGPVPLASNVNFTTGQTVANLAFVAPAADGTVCVQSNVATHLIVDAVGWFGANGRQFQASSPRRLVDTRGARGGPQGPLPAGGVVTVPVGAPALLNVTAVQPNAAGYVTTYPCGPTPLVSTLNYVPGATVPNLAPVAVNGAGSTCVATSQRADLVIDLLGTFVP
jgi:hypothetical protein